MLTASEPVIYATLPWVTPINYPDVVVSVGKNRNEFSSLNVSTDSEAIAIWLADSGQNSVNTAQSYRREIERFLLWATTIKGKSLSSLFREDFLEYSKFLANLPEEWMMDSRHARTSNLWRPFLGQPGLKSQTRSMGVLNSLITYLVKAGWLRNNPMPMIKRAKIQEVNSSQRSLSPEDIECVIEALLRMPDSTPRETTTKARDAWLFYLYWTTGARASETELPMSNFNKVSINGDSSWVWDITGKGNKLAQIPLAKKTMLRLMAFRKCLKISLLPLHNDIIPIMPSLRRMNQDGVLTAIPAPLSRRAIYKRFKLLFNSAINISEERGMHSTQLRKASTHWLRHTSIREFYDVTGNLKLTQQFARHGNINTTAGYATQSLSMMQKAIAEKG
jgi:integrase/recombinase XerD